ncbi:MAG: hypothetical protein IPK52_22480 [Chloroflexi bacterium]|nr:hypothetical protein [Chloroflexota bacterium]
MVGLAVRVGGRRRRGGTSVGGTAVGLTAGVGVVMAKTGDDPLTASARRNMVNAAARNTRIEVTPENDISDLRIIAYIAPQNGV